MLSGRNTPPSGIGRVSFVCASTMSFLGGLGECKGFIQGFVNSPFFCPMGYFFAFRMFVPVVLEDGVVASPLRATARVQYWLSQARVCLGISGDVGFVVVSCVVLLWRSNLSKSWVRGRHASALEVLKLESAMCCKLFEGFRNETLVEKGGSCLCTRRGARQSGRLRRTRLRLFGWSQDFAVGNCHSEIGFCPTLVNQVGVWIGFLPNPNPILKKCCGALLHSIS